MAKHNNLESLFKATADAIRSKTGSTDKIVADDFPTAIESITTGHPNGTEWTKALNSSIDEIQYFSGKWIFSSFNYMSNGHYTADLNNWKGFDIGVGNIRKYSGVLVGISDYLRNPCYSFDGASWNRCSTISNVYALYVRDDILWCESDDKYFYSNDGISWNKSDSAPSNTWTDHEQQVYASGVYVTCGSYGIRYSIDRLSWEQSNITDFTDSVKYGNGMFVSLVRISDKESGLYYSVDGRYWERSCVIANSVSHISYNKGVFCCFEYNDSNGYFKTNIRYSHDGTNWSIVDHDFDYTISHFCDGMWFVCESVYEIDDEGNKKGNFVGSRIYYSRNGIDYIESYSSTYNIYSGHKMIKQLGGIWFAFYCDEYVLYSSDGVSWKRTNIPNLLDIEISHNGSIWFFYSYWSDTIYYWTASSNVGSFCVPKSSNKIKCISLVNDVWFLHGDIGVYYSIRWLPEKGAG